MEGVPEVPLRDEAVAVGVDTSHQRVHVLRLQCPQPEPVEPPVELRAAQEPVAVAVEGPKRVEHEHALVLQQRAHANLQRPQLQQVVPFICFSVSRDIWRDDCESNEGSE